MGFINFKQPAFIQNKSYAKALRDFLQQFGYPARAPVSTDLINAILKVSDAKYHTQSRDLFEKE
ncbi:hypothetical protein SAMN04488132_11420 [Sediminibacterium ginsengisoli]|uniref:Uncharacterized protein n=1 Tax=Sediminibacterium ginsengisoli TaxID=413434 RepID=A0A1T4RR68_9BACT|nr:hypothetical protein SAMN04488132_11420 [Sediminibacterium ginsengisoli]